MYQLHMGKQQKYFKGAIRLHYEEGCGENRIAGIIPIGQTTAARWIAVFAREKGKIRGMTDMAKTQGATSVQADGKDVKGLQKKIKELEAQLKDELLLGKAIHGIGEVIAAVAVAEDSYGNRHPHMSIGMMAPAEADDMTDDRDMRWVSHRLLAIKFRNMTDVTGKDLPLQPVSGIILAYGLQSTTGIRLGR